MWRAAARAAGIGNRLLTVMAGLLVFLMLTYGTYSLWDTYRMSQNAFVSAELLNYKPGGAESAGFDELRKVNSDVCAWITIPDTHIDYPVLQGENDMVYVNQDVYGEFSLSGAIFLASVDSPDFSDGYSLLYGHHMENGAMFGDVTKFTEKAYFEEHPDGLLYLPEKTLAIHIFASVETDAYDEQIYHSGKDADVSGLLSHIREKAVQHREVVQGERLIGLSTCADDVGTNGRVVVFGWLEEMPAGREV